MTEPLRTSEPLPSTGGRTDAMEAAKRLIAWDNRRADIGDAAVVSVAGPLVKDALIVARSLLSSDTGGRTEEVREALEELICAVEAVEEVKRKTKKRLYDDAPARIGDKHDAETWLAAALKDAHAALSPSLGEKE